MNNKIIKKKDRAKELISKKESLFKCPLCSGAMSMNDTYSLTCQSKHTFDLSKKGYLNLLTTATSPVYSKELFEARHKVCKAGFYDPLIDALEEIISRYQKRIIKKDTSILDDGWEKEHIFMIFIRELMKAGKVLFSVWIFQKTVLI